MELLKAVNQVLPKLGERPVTSLTGRHPTVALILSELSAQVDTLCQRGWWFNEFDTELLRDPDGEIALPVKTLAFVPKYPDYKPVQRSGKLFNGDTLTYKWDTSLEGTITLHVPFEELPESAAQYAWYSALCAAYVTDIGVAQDLQIWTQAAASARNDMEAEHLVQKNYSTARSRRYRRVRSAMRG